jgi:hypothetical protein
VNKSGTEVRISGSRDAVNAAILLVNQQIDTFLASGAHCRQTTGRLFQQQLRSLPNNTYADTKSGVAEACLKCCACRHAGNDGVSYCAACGWTCVTSCRQLQQSICILAWDTAFTGTVLRQHEVLGCRRVVADGSHHRLGDCHSHNKHAHVACVLQAEHTTILRRCTTC